MRKDLRIGLGIGGVLLAVLIVSLIVRSNNKKHDTGGQEVAQADGQNPYGDDATAPADPATPAADPTADPAAPVMPPMPTANGGRLPCFVAFKVASITINATPTSAPMPIIFQSRPPPITPCASAEMSVA